VPVEREDVEKVVAVDDRTVLVDHLHAVAVAVEGDAEIGTFPRTESCSARRSVAQP
jgi:hypothetical protein